MLLLFFRPIPARWYPPPVAELVYLAMVWTTIVIFCRASIWLSLAERRGCGAISCVSDGHCRLAFFVGSRIPDQLLRWEAEYRVAVYVLSLLSRP